MVVTASPEASALVEAAEVVDDTPKAVAVVAEAIITATEALAACNGFR